MFLKNNRRIEALITVICFALLIFCLVERALRQAICPHRGPQLLRRQGPSPRARDYGAILPRDRRRSTRRSGEPVNRYSLSILPARPDYSRSYATSPS
jgi:hypothetical protein